MNGADLVAQLERLHDLVVADATHLDVVGTFGDLKRRLHPSHVTIVAIYSQRCYRYKSACGDGELNSFIGKRAANSPNSSALASPRS
jgi:hypothetical protein